MQKKSLAALVPALFISMGFVVVGINVMYRYRNSPGDWHFIVALVASVIWLLAVVVIASRILKSRTGNKA